MLVQMEMFLPQSNGLKKQTLLVSFLLPVDTVEPTHIPTSLLNSVLGSVQNSNIT